VTLFAEIVLIVLAGVAIATCVTLLPAPRPLRRRKPVPAASSRPQQLVALERLVTTSGSSALSVHAYLRPLLIQIVSHRLAVRGQTIERMPEAVGREALGDRLWDVVRPDRPFPEDRHGPGVRPQELGALLEVIRRL
jgi:hypothetical protein